VPANIAHQIRVSRLHYLQMSSIKRLEIPIVDFRLRNSEFKTLEKEDFPRRNLPRPEGKGEETIRRILHPPPGFRGVR
jgi:hypothetical protein